MIENIRIEKGDSYRILASGSQTVKIWSIREGFEPYLFSTVSSGSDIYIGPFSNSTMFRIDSEGTFTFAKVNQDFKTPSLGSPAPKLLSADLSITNTNAFIYDGAVLECSTALTITLGPDLPESFGVIVIPPSSGNASIASSGGVLINGDTDTLTRAAAENAMVAIVQRASSANSYVVSGS